MKRVLTLSAIAFLTACGDGSVRPTSPRAAVREHITAWAPAANIGHRGAGVSVPGNAYPENSLSSVREAISQGAVGVELDFELTADGRLVAMHDDTLDRTTTCSGCMSGYTFAEVRECRLLDGDGTTTDQIPPTLEESFAALPDDALVNVELKAYGSNCRTPTTGPEDLARVAVTEIRRLGVADRTAFSSFDTEAVAAVRRHGDLYSGLLLTPASSNEEAWPASLARATELDQDAIHPFFAIPPAGIDAAHAAGLQVNVWTVNEQPRMEQMLDANVDVIITDVPSRLAEGLGDR